MKINWPKLDAGVGIATITITSWPMHYNGRALSVAQEIRISANDGSVLVSRIRTDQQAVFEMLRSGENGRENPPLEEAQKVAR